MPTIRAKIKRGTASMLVAISLMTIAIIVVATFVEYRKSNRATVERATAILKEMRSCLDLRDKNEAISEREMDRLYRQCWEHSTLIITDPIVK